MTDAPKPPAPFPERVLRAAWMLLTEIKSGVEAIKRTAAALERLADVADRIHPEPLPTVDLDDPQRGDPVARMDPKDWKGASQKQKPYSRCPPEFLDELAKTLEYFASQATDAKKKRFDRLDAARARGWAARLRAGWTPPSPSSSSHAAPPVVRPPAAPPPVALPPVSLPPTVAHATKEANGLDPVPFEDTSDLDDLPSFDDDDGSAEDAVQ